MKTCSKCKVEKEESEFYRYKSTKDSLSPQCKACKKAYETANRENIRARKKAYKAANREKTNARHRAYCEANRENARAISRAYCSRLTDSYISIQLSKDTSLKPKEIPKELIDLKRVQLQTIREIRRQNEQHQ